MNNTNMSVYIECGKKGVGKTTAVKSKWQKHIIFRCGDPINEVKTNVILSIALSNVYGESNQEPLVYINQLNKALREGYVLIIDQAEDINEEILELILNAARLHDNSCVVFTFDIKKEHIHKNHIFSKLLDSGIISADLHLTNYLASYDTFKAIISSKIVNASEKFISEMIELSNLNFFNINKLLWLALNMQSDFESVDEDVVREYTICIVDDKLSKLPTDMKCILKKSSLIGEMFQTCVLESPNGFNIQGVKTYLEKLEQTNLFIKRYLHDSVYQFISDEEYLGILNSINPTEKIELQKILLNYYLRKIALEHNCDKLLEYLLQVRQLSKALNDFDNLFYADKRLLFQYIRIEDNVKVRDILQDLLSIFMESSNDNMLYIFLCYYKIRHDMSMGFFKDALKVIKHIQENYPNNSNLFLQFYYASSLYMVGDIDSSYIEVKSLQSSIKSSSSESVNNQPIYALTYSLLATIQHHFGIEDCGHRYYRLALSHAEKINDYTIFFDILRKCDMYYSLEYSKTFLKRCYIYFESVGKVYDSAKVKVNLGIELIFNNYKYKSEAKSLLESATEIFYNTPNENLAYSINNLALIQIIGYGDFEAALVLLNKSLLIGMSDFTYMTIYLNICMCHLFLTGSASEELAFNYAKFCYYNNLIKSRRHSTQYDDIYKTLLDLTIMEHKEERNEVAEKAKVLLDKGKNNFFVPLIKNIIKRNEQNYIGDVKYNDNYAFYDFFDRHKLFMAEFRFWE